MTEVKPAAESDQGHNTVGLPMTSIASRHCSHLPSGGAASAELSAPFQVELRGEKQGLSICAAFVGS